MIEESSEEVQEVKAEEPVSLSTAPPVREGSGEEEVSE
jgi:hypothetical protein